MEARLKEIIAEVIAGKVAGRVQLKTMAGTVHEVVQVAPQFDPQIGGHQGRSSGVLRQSSVVVSVAHAVDELVFRGHRWRGAAVGDQTLCRKPEEPVTGAGR
jgi:hypothetical protein